MNRPGPLPTAGALKAMAMVEAGMKIRAQAAGGAQRVRRGGKDPARELPVDSTRAEWTAAHRAGLR